MATLTPQLDRWVCPSQSEMSPVYAVQGDNATPIVLNPEKSFTLGILGTTGLWQSTNLSAPGWAHLVPLLHSREPRGSTPGDPIMDVRSGNLLANAPGGSAHRQL